MPVNPDFKDLLRLLNSANIRYLVVGAYAVTHYTEPRYTKDIDIWIATDSANAKKVYNALKAFGAPMEEISPKDLENPELVYQIGIEPNRVDIMMGMGGLSFETAWNSRVTASYGEEAVHLIGLEDLIKTKEKADRPQDRIDLQSLRKQLFVGRNSRD